MEVENKLQELSDYLINGKHLETERITKELVEDGVKSKTILDEGLMKGMAVVGQRFRDQQMFVPQVLVAARAMKFSMKVLEPLMIGEANQSKGKILLGTVKGDVHDIGKNLVGIMLQGAGYDVIDIGTGITAEKYNEKYGLSEEQISEYQKNGFIRLRNVLTGESLEYANKVIGAAVKARTDKDTRKLEEKSQYEQSFMQCGYLAWDFPAVKDFVFGKRFAGIARDLMKVNGIRLWHDQALYKEPGGRITDCHQDESYWPIDSKNTTTMWMALVDVPEEKGCMRFVPGSHEWGVQEYVDIFDQPHVPDSVKEENRIALPLNAGDVTFHSGLTFHEAFPNKTNKMREAMTVIYFEDGAKYTAEDERSKDHDSCEGLEHGEVIDTKFTPKLI